MSHSEARNSGGKAFIEIPMLDEMMHDHAVNAMSEGDYWPNAVLAQIVVRPGRVIAIPIAMWRPATLTLDNAVTYWTPTSVPIAASDLVLAPLDVTSDVPD
jgi:hypothetical protein